MHFIAEKYNVPLPRPFFSCNRMPLNQKSAFKKTTENTECTEIVLYTKPIIIKGYSKKNENLININ